MVKKDFYSMCSKYPNHTVFIYVIVHDKKILLFSGLVNNVLIYTSHYLDNSKPVIFTRDYINKNIEVFISLD